MERCCIVVASRPSQMNPPPCDFPDQTAFHQGVVVSAPPPKKTPVTCELRDEGESFPSTFNTLDTQAGSFDETLAALLLQLQLAISTQHEIVVRQREKKVAEQFDAFRNDTHVPVGAAQAVARGDQGSLHPMYVSTAAAQLVARSSPRRPDALLTESEYAATPQHDSATSTVASPRAIVIAGKDAEVQTHSARVPLTAKSGDSRGRNHMFPSMGSSPSLPSSRVRAEIKEVRQLKFFHHLPEDLRTTKRAPRSRSSRALEAGTQLLRLDRIARNFMNFVVITHVVLLGFQATSSWTGWVYVDTGFFTVFGLELVCRFWRGGANAFNWSRTDGRWSLFDLFLLFMTGAEVGWAWDSLVGSQSVGENHFSKFTSLRMVRMIRILRILRLSQLDFFKDLALMVAGAVGGLRTLMWSIVMIMLPVYGVALFFTETLGKGDEDNDMTELFSDMKMSMFTTFRCLVAGDCSAANGTPIFLHVLKEFGWVFIVVYCLAFIFMSFGLFNVIVAIYVESTVASAKANEDVQRRRRLEDYVRLSCKLFELVLYVYEEFELGPDHEKGEPNLKAALAAEMTQEQFMEVIKDSKVRTLLHDCDVPEEDFMQLFDICDADGGGYLSLDEMVGGVRKLRGTPRRSDVVWVQLRVQELQNEVIALHGKLDNLRKSRGSLRVAETGEKHNFSAPVRKIDQCHVFRHYTPSRESSQKGCTDNHCQFLALWDDRTSYSDGATSGGSRCYARRPNPHCTLWSVMNLDSRDEGCVYNLGCSQPFTSGVPTSPRFW